MRNSIDLAKNRFWRTGDAFWAEETEGMESPIVKKTIEI
jgi:hypothetical protein